MTAAEIAAVALLLLGLGLIIAGLLLASFRQPEDEDVDIEEVAQAIARCYGHGPLRVMDPHYQHEFRRDARAAIAAMRRR